MNRLRTVAVTLVFLVVLAAAVNAHDTWLIPERFSATPNSSVVLDLTSGMAFPLLDTAIKPERIEHANCRLAGERFELADVSSGAKSLRFKALLPKTGLATCWVELKPKALDLTPKQVREYLDEIDAPAAIRQEWAATKEPKRWREVYQKHAKTFIRVGESPSDPSWAEPVGMSLEIVPDNDPTKLRRGQSVSLRVLENGLPLAGFPIGFVREGSHKGVIRRTDDQGRVKFRVALAGRWLLRGTKLRKATQPEVDWESDFTTLTLIVR